MRVYLRRIANHHENKRMDAIESTECGYPLLQNAILEATEFIDIQSGLGSSQDPRLAERLRDFVAGAPMLSAETPNANRPRNIGFELSIAAAVVSAGLPVDLSPPADISIPISPHPFYR